MGDTNIESVVDNQTPGQARAFLYTAAVNGSANRLWIYVDAGDLASTIIVGLYIDASGNPGTLLASGTIASPTKGAWNAVAISATSITSGTRYWIAVLGPSSGSAVSFRDLVSGGGPSQTSKRTNLTALPSNWSTGSTSSRAPMPAYAANLSAALLSDSVLAQTDTLSTAATDSAALAASLDGEAADQLDDLAAAQVGAGAELPSAPAAKATATRTPNPTATPTPNVDTEPDQHSHADPRRSDRHPNRHSNRDANEHGDQHSRADSYHDQHTHIDEYLAADSNPIGHERDELYVRSERQPLEQGAGRPDHKLDLRSRRPHSDRRPRQLHGQQRRQPDR